MQCTVLHRPAEGDEGEEYGVLIRRVLACRFTDFTFYNQKGRCQNWSLLIDIRDIIAASNAVVGVYEQIYLRGLCLLTVGSRVVKINYLRSCQRGGGRRMIDAVFALARQLEKPHVELEALKDHYFDNKNQQSLVDYYGKFGFRAVDALLDSITTTTTTPVVPMRADVV
jgi:hypothetical protein